METEFMPFTLEELRTVELGVIIPIAEQMGIPEATGARRDTIVGMVFVAQNHHPEVAEQMREKLFTLQQRHVRHGADKVVEKKPRQKSAVFGAVAQVHKICSENPGLDRKALIELCVKAGINKNTAATQYAKWKRDNGG